MSLLLVFIGAFLGAMAGSALITYSFLRHFYNQGVQEGEAIMEEMTDGVPIL